MQNVRSIEAAATEKAARCEKNENLSFFFVRFSILCLCRQAHRRADSIRCGGRGGERTKHSFGRESRLAVFNLDCSIMIDF